MTSNTFIPNFQYIIGITNAQYPIVTFAMTHNFSPGEIVSFRVTQPFGMVEINNLQGNVLATTSNTITVDIDTTFWTPFVYPVSGKVSPPTCVPVGSGIVPGSIPPTIGLQDAFDNVPSQV